LIFEILNLVYGKKIPHLKSSEGVPLEQNLKYVVLACKIGTGFLQLGAT